MLRKAQSLQGHVALVKGLTFGCTSVANDFEEDPLPVAAVDEFRDRPAIDLLCICPIWIVGE